MKFLSGSRSANRRRHARALLPAAVAVSLTACGIGTPGNAADAERYTSGQHDFRLETMATGFDRPWAMAFLPDGDVLVTERHGGLLRVGLESGEKREIVGVPEVARINQGGLLDVALHPDFTDNGWVYLTYSVAGEGGYTTRLARARLDGDALTGLEVLLTAEPFVDGGRHFGSRLVFDDQGYLFMTVGERGHRAHAQSKTKLHGKLLRLNPDGSIPAGNPFVDDPDAHDAIYSLGHRNPQGMALHPETRRVWLHEHGPRGGDEINVPEPGENYGWPETTYGVSYSGPRFAPKPPVEGYVSPIYHWTPSIAPSGMAFYTGDTFPGWQGDLFVGALKLTHLARLELDGGKVLEDEELLADAGMRIRAVSNGPDGGLYLLVDDADAPMLRLMPVD